MAAALSAFPLRADQLRHSSLYKPTPPQQAHCLGYAGLPWAYSQEAQYHTGCGLRYDAHILEHQEFHTILTALQCVNNGITFSGH